jgi:hypothetical protein
VAGHLRVSPGVRRSVHQPPAPERPGDSGLPDDPGGGRDRPDRGFPGRASGVRSASCSSVGRGCSRSRARRSSSCGPSPTRR